MYGIANAAPQGFAGVREDVHTGAERGKFNANVASHSPHPTIEPFAQQSVRRFISRPESSGTAASEAVPIHLVTSHSSGDAQEECFFL